MKPRAQSWAQFKAAQTSECFDPREWHPGMVINRRGRRGVVVDEGIYRSTKTRGRWYFMVETSVGMEIWTPCVGDEAMA